MKNIDKKDIIRGSMFGGAVGDALGYPVEFMPLSQIHAKYGENGITEYEGSPALISDDTQMALFTANIVLFAETRGSETKEALAWESKYIYARRADKRRISRLIRQMDKNKK